MSPVPCVKTCPVCKNEKETRGIFCSPLCELISNLREDLRQLDYKMDDIQRDVEELKK